MGQINMVKLRIIVTMMMLISCISISSVEANTSSVIIFPNKGINTQIYGLVPGNSILPMVSKFPTENIHPKFVVQNIGRRPVHAKVWKTDSQQFEEINGATIFPGQRVALENYNIRCRETRLAVYNYDNTRAVFHVSTGLQVVPNNPPPNYDANKAFIGTFELGVKSLPPTRKGPLALLLKFWPVGKPNVWQQILPHIKVLLDSKVIEILEEIFEGNLVHIHRQVIALNAMVENKNPKCRTFYLNLAQTLSTLPNKFRLADVAINDIWTVNFKLVPFYTLAVTFMTAFYALGIANPDTYRLHPGDVHYLKVKVNKFINDTNGAIHYVQNMYKQQVDDAYKHVYTGGLYNPIMNHRSYIILSAMEAIPLWIQAVKNPQSDQQPYIDAISYSNFFGIATPNLFQQALPTYVKPPLTPYLKVDKRREKLVRFDIYKRLVGRERIIVGTTLYFESSNYVMGSVTNDQARLDLNGARINWLRVYGNNNIDSLIFYLSDGRQVYFGSAHHNNFVDFRLANHHIVSFYLANDFSSVGQASSIAVSYQINELVRS